MITRLSSLEGNGVVNKCSSMTSDQTHAQACPSKDHSSSTTTKMAIAQSPNAIPTRLLLWSNVKIKSHIWSNLWSQLTPLQSWTSSLDFRIDESNKKISCLLVYHIKRSSLSNLTTRIIYILTRSFGKLKFEKNLKTHTNHQNMITHSPLFLL